VGHQVLRTAACKSDKYRPNLCTDDKGCRELRTVQIRSWAAQQTELPTQRNWISRSDNSTQPHMISHGIWRHMLIHEIKITIQSPFLVWNKHERRGYEMGRRFNKHYPTYNGQSQGAALLMLLLLKLKACLASPNVGSTCISFGVYLPAHDSNS
jgi:hypothetical protein